MRRGRVWQAVLLAIVSSALLTPALLSSRLNDDHLFGSPLIADSTPTSAYELFSPSAPSSAPWWTADGARLRFFRPLASVTLWLDRALLGEAPLAAHLHSLLWFLAFLLGGFLLLGRLLDGRRLTWAWVILALATFHSWAAGWVAAQHAAEVVAAAAAGPTVIDFTLDGLDDRADACLITMDAGLFRPVALPEVGRSVQVTYALPLMDDSASR